MAGAETVNKDVDIELTPHLEQMDKTDFGSSDGLLQSGSRKSMKKGVTSEQSGVLDMDEQDQRTEEAHSSHSVKTLLKSSGSCTQKPSLSTTDQVHEDVSVHPAEAMQDSRTVLNAPSHSVTESAQNPPGLVQYATTSPQSTKASIPHMVGKSKSNQMLQSTNSAEMLTQRSCKSVSESRPDFNDSIHFAEAPQESVGNLTNRSRKVTSEGAQQSSVSVHCSEDMLTKSAPEHTDLVHSAETIRGSKADSLASTARVSGTSTANDAENPTDSTEIQRESKASIAKGSDKVIAEDAKPINSIHSAKSLRESKASTTQGSSKSIVGDAKQPTDSIHSADTLRGSKASTTGGSEKSSVEDTKRPVHSVHSTETGAEERIESVHSAGTLEGPKGNTLQGSDKSIREDPERHADSVGSQRGSKASTTQGSSKSIVGDAKKPIDSIHSSDTMRGSKASTTGGSEKSGVDDTKRSVHSVHSTETGAEERIESVHSAGTLRSSKGTTLQVSDKSILEDPESHAESDGIQEVNNMPDHSVHSTDADAEDRIESVHSAGTLKTSSVQQPTGSTQPAVTLKESKASTLRQSGKSIAEDDEECIDSLHPAETSKVSSPDIHAQISSSIAIVVQEPIDSVHSGEHLRSSSAENAQSHIDSVHSTVTQQESRDSTAQRTDKNVTEYIEGPIDSLHSIKTLDESIASITERSDRSTAEAMLKVKASVVSTQTVRESKASTALRSITFSKGEDQTSDSQHSAQTLQESKEGSSASRSTKSILEGKESSDVFTGGTGAGRRSNITGIAPSVTFTNRGHQPGDTLEDDRSSFDFQKGTSDDLSLSQEQTSIATTVVSGSQDQQKLVVATRSADLSTTKTEKVLAKSKSLGTATATGKSRATKSKKRLTSKSKIKMLSEGSSRLSKQQDHSANSECDKARAMSDGGISALAPKTTTKIRRVFGSSTSSPFPPGAQKQRHSLAFRKNKTISGLTISKRATSAMKVASTAENERETESQKLQGKSPTTPIGEASTFVQDTSVVLERHPGELLAPLEDDIGGSDSPFVDLTDMVPEQTAPEPQKKKKVAPTKKSRKSNKVVPVSEPVGDEDKELPPKLPKKVPPTESEETVVYSCFCTLL